MKCCRPTMVNSKQNAQQQEGEKRQHWTSRPKPKYDKYTRRWLVTLNVSIWTDNAIPWNRKYIIFFPLQGDLGEHMIRWGGIREGVGESPRERKGGITDSLQSLLVGWLDFLAELPPGDKVTNLWASKAAVSSTARLWTILCLVSRLSAWRRWKKRPCPQPAYPHGISATVRAAEELTLRSWRLVPNEGGCMTSSGWRCLDFLLVLWYTICETRMTAIVLKQDRNTQMVQRTAYLSWHRHTICKPLVVIPFVKLQNDT